MRSKTHDEYVSELKIKNPSILVRGTYINKRTKIEVECKVCGRVWMARPSDLLSGSKCMDCTIKARRKTHEQFVQELNEVNPNIEILSEYKNNHEKVECKCKIDGHIWFAAPANLLNNHGCPKCSNKYNRTPEEFVSEIAKISPTIEILSDFNNVSENVKCKCKVDGHIWYASPRGLLKGYGCKVCNESKGEKKIKECLTKHNVDFVWQKSFDGLTGVKGGLLSYDFYIPKYNLLVEYQGEFHDGTVKYQSGKDFAIRIEHDKRKSNYAKLHNFEFLEIWYWDFENVENILIDKLDELRRKEVA